MANKKTKKRARRPVHPPATKETAIGTSPHESIVSEDKPAAPYKEKPADKPKGKSKDKTPSKAKAREVKRHPNKKPGIFRRIIEYFKAVRLEIKRTTWPTRHEILNMSIIVVFALLFFGILIFILDQIMVSLLNLYSHVVPNASGVIDASSVADVSSAAVDSSSITSDTTAVDPSSVTGDTASAGDTAAESDGGQ
ncbi:MAG: preprotein translocase subunit SecE [Coriobacteriales bacterium]|jgi:preprotein translocase subunit SecE|nr:preprotein translocase subunit SecE [Coriobacteriales bacterium]